MSGKENRKTVVVESLSACPHPGFAFNLPTMGDDSFELTHPVVSGGRDDDDHFPTPEWAPQLMLSRAQKEGWLQGVHRLVDPCAAEGALLQVARRMGYATGGLELNEGRAALARRYGFAVKQANSLETGWGLSEGDAVLSNPPYKLADEFVLAALKREALHMPVMMLLRLSFLGAKKRVAMHKHFRPDVYVLDTRPAYLGPNKGTDSVDSAWFVWRPGCSGRWDILEKKEIT